MPALRVTHTTLRTNVLTGLQQNLDRLQTLQERLSSGRQLRRPSDSPVGTAEAMSHRSSLRRNEQFARNAQDGMGWLGTADTTLTSSFNLVRRARDLVLGAVNGARGQEALNAIAQEVEAVRDGLIALANTRYIDRPIFAGNAATGAAYDATGAYLGDGGIVERTVAEGATVQVNLPGEAVFGSPGGGAPRLFDLLTTIAADLRAGNIAAVSGADLANLDASRRLVQDQLSSLGARYNRIETMRDRADDLQLTLRNSLSEVEDIDLPKTMVDLQLQEVAYKTALAATARVVQPSLVDFLR